MLIKLTRQRIPWIIAAGRAALGPVVILGEKCRWNGILLATLIVSALVSDIFDGDRQQWCGVLRGEDGDHSRPSASAYCATSKAS